MRPRASAALVLALLGAGAPVAAQAPARYVLYLHGRIVEDSGTRRPVSPVFGPYEYDAILTRLRQAGFAVLSEQRPARASSEVYAARAADQVDSLRRLGVPARNITVVGFSKGGWLAILASARLADPELGFVFLASCGEWSNDPADLHVAGRILSIYETSDSLGHSCAPMFARARPGSRTRELSVSLGKGHGTFFVPRDAWLGPVIAWARGEEP